VQNRTRGGRSAAALALTVCQMVRNSVRPVPQEPPILVVTQTLLRPLRPPPPAVVRPLLPPHGTSSSPFIGEEHRPGSPDDNTRHARQPATPAGHGARRTAARSGRRPQAPTGGRRPLTYGRPPRTPPTGGRRAQAPTGGRRPLTYGRPPRTPPTGGRRAHHRRPAAAHTTDGRPRPTPTTESSRPTPTTAGRRKKSARAPRASTRVWPGQPPSAYRRGSRAHEKRGRGAEGRSDAGKGKG